MFFRINKNKFKTLFAYTLFFYIHLDFFSFPLLQFFLFELCFWSTVTSFATFFSSFLNFVKITSNVSLLKVTFMNFDHKLLLPLSACVCVCMDFYQVGFRNWFRFDLIWSSYKSTNFTLQSNWCNVLIILLIQLTM